MAKLFDKLFNRIIKGRLIELSDSEINDLGLQHKLVSGTNIKTIGGQSVLGSGDIAISGSQLYNHRLAIEDNDDNTYYFEIVNNSQEPIDTLTKLIGAMKYNTGLGSTKYRIYLGYFNVSRCYISKNDDANYLSSSSSVTTLSNGRPLTAFHDSVETL